MSEDKLLRSSFEDSKSLFTNIACELCSLGVETRVSSQFQANNKSLIIRLHNIPRILFPGMLPMPPHRVTTSTRATALSCLAIMFPVLFNDRALFSYIHNHFFCLLTVRSMEFIHMQVGGERGDYYAKIMET